MFIHLKNKLNFGETLLLVVAVLTAVVVPIAVGSTSSPQGRSIAPAAGSQADFNGKWRTEAPGGLLTGLDVITMEFKVDNGKVTGSITRTDPPGQPPVVIEGTATSDTINFVVKSPDRQRTITFTGKLRGDAIEFNREATGTGAGGGIYGITGPATLNARRLTSESPRGNAPRLKFAAASLRKGGMPGVNGFELNRIKCRGVDGELWSPNDWVDPTPARQGRCTGGNVPLISLLATAYSASQTVRIVGSPLSAQTYYQIEAVADDPARVTKGELREMLQTLLEDRFRAQVHPVTRELDGYILTVAKSGIKFKETSGREQIVSADPYLKGKYTMDRVVILLNYLLGSAPIVDKTGLTGLYEMTFMVDEILPPPDPNNAGARGGPGGPQRPREFSPSIPKAFEDQLGLHLERGKVPVEFLVIDRLELAMEN